MYIPAPCFSGNEWDGGWYRGLERAVKLAPLPWKHHVVLPCSPFFLVPCMSSLALCLPPSIHPNVAFPPFAATSMQPAGSDDSQEDLQGYGLISWTPVEPGLSPGGGGG